MAKCYDHFHAIVTLSNGYEEEIEGGWTGYPRGWHLWEHTMQNKWLKDLCEQWNSTGHTIVAVKSFRLAG